MVFLPHWPVPHGKKDINLGLSRVKELLARLHHPEDKLPPVIHVAGTNGKGSTLAYLKTIFETSGYKVHRYISPHITRFNERIMIAGEEISDEALYETMEQTRIACGDLQTTFFEGTTAGAFLAFSKTPADILLLETGMGGRLDATNVVEKPIMTIITPISDDHMEYLGDSIAKIAAEKAGIIKEGVPCIIGWQFNEAFDVLVNKCKEMNAPYYAWGEHWDFEVTEDGFDFIDLETEEVYPFPQPSLFGLHQIMNAACVVAAARSLDFNLSYGEICQGLTQTKWPARMQRITSGVLSKLLPKGYELWVDGAHNSNGAEMISATIANLWSDKPTYLVNGRTGNRDIVGFLEYFKGKVEAVYGIKVQSEPLGELAINIVNGAKSIGFDAYECDDITHAIKTILSHSPKPARILVCGSLYLAGDVLLANNL
jgi:dihydrofolate synthase / folylpolyglutamate synthase